MLLASNITYTRLYTLDHFVNFLNSSKTYPLRTIDNRIIRSIIRIKKMKVKWNNCFLCLNDLSVGALDEGTSPKKKRKVRKQNNSNAKCKSIRASSVLLLNYLLDARCKKYSDVIDNIVKLIEIKENESEAVSNDDLLLGIEFCDKCETQLRAVSELHQQLEVVQMKLVQVLKFVRSTVILNSEKNNCENIGLKMFESWLKDREKQVKDGKQNLLTNQREILNVLYSFQTGVIENVKNSIDIPRIFLDNFTYFKPQPTLENSKDLFNLTVKTESIDLDEVMHDNMPSPENLDWFAEIDDNEQVNVESPQPIDLKPRIRKRKTVSSTADARVKDEDDDEIVPQKKIRTASFAASLRKKKKRKCIQEKKEKTEPSKEEQARILQPFKLQPHSEKQKCYRPGQYWACATCDFVSRNVYRFQHHLRTHEMIAEVNDSSSIPLFCCEKCVNTTFSVEQHYQFHEACHLGAISMPCDICNATCEPMSLESHIKIHVEKTFPCPNCYYCCSTRENYLHHLTYHINSDIHECDICREICTSRKLLIDHYYKDHQALEMQACNVNGCTKEFLDPEVLLRHKASHKNSFVCQHCGKSLCSAISLEIHLASQHTGEKRFACQHCSETFTVKSSLNRHMVRQHAAPKVKCDYCEKEYAEMSTLKVHMAQVHTGSEFVCDYPECGKIFGNRTLLKRHRAIHSEERKFPCEECGKRFKLAQDVKKHMFSHYGEKKFKCQFCEKSFLYEKYLTQHLRIHTGEKPFVCDHCGTAFNQYAALYVHKRNCHESRMCPV